MSAKPFWKWLKPDNKQKAYRNPLQVGGFVVDQWRKMAYVGVFIGFCGTAAGAAGWGYGLYKEQLPTPILTPMVNAYGRLATLYTTNVDDALDENIVGAVLRVVIDDLRTLTTEPDARKRLEHVGLFFVDDASRNLTRFLKQVDFGKPLLDRNFKRQVSTQIEVTRVPNTPDIFQIHWKEKLVSPVGTGEWQDRSMVVQVRRQTDVPAELAMINPWGVFIADFSSDTLD